MKASPIQSNFIGGEFSPILNARVDSEIYPTALSVCKNYIPLIQGPLTRRPGTYFVQKSKNSGSTFREVHLIPFRYSNIQNYMIEFGDGYARFYRNNGPVESSPGVPVEISTPYAHDHVANIYFVQSADVIYLFHPLYQPRKLTRASHTSWTLTVIQFLDGPYLPQNVGTTTLTPSATTGGITITASAATFASTDVGRLVRMKHSGTWGYAVILTYTSPTLVGAIVINAFGASTAVTIWRLGLWSNTTGYPSCGTFHEDRLFIGGNASNPQRLDGSVSGDYENFAPTGTDATVVASNSVGFSLNSTDVNVVQWMTSDEKGLLVGTTASEWTVRAASSIEALSPTNITAKKASTYGSARVQPVQVGKSALFIQSSARKLRDMRYYYDVDGFRAADLTVLSEHITSAGFSNSFVSGAYNGQVSSGVIQIAYQQNPQQIVWAVRADGALIGMTYEREFETVKAGWHRHQIGGYGDIAKNPAKVKSIAVIPSADGTRDELWLAVERWVNGSAQVHIEYLTEIFDDDSSISDAYFLDAGLSYDNPQLTSSGAFTFGTTTVVNFPSHPFANGDKILFNDVPGTVELNGQSYLVANKTANTFEIKTLAGVAVNSTTWTAYAYDGTNGAKIRKYVSTVSGLSHLEGQTVGVLADGSVQTSKVVSGGSITLDSSAAIIHVGFGYQSDGQQLRLEAGSTDGTAHGKTQRVHRVAFHFHRSLGLQYGMDFTKLQELTFRKTSDSNDRATDPFSGIIGVSLPANYNTHNQICWRQEQPLPSTILAIMPQLVTQDRG